MSAFDTLIQPAGDYSSPEASLKSITNILNALPKDALPYWAAKVTSETAVYKNDILQTLIADSPQAAINWLKRAPWDQRDKAADIGTAVHSIVELDATGRSDEADAILALLDEVGQAKARQARAFFRDFDCTVDAVEFVVYHRGHGYAGTGDFIITLGDNAPAFPLVDKPNPKIMVDLKTGSGVWPEASLQIAAARFATEMVDFTSTGIEREDLRRQVNRGRTYVMPPPEVKLLPVPETDGGAVLHVTEDSWSFIPVDASEDTFQQFLRVLEVSKFLPLDKLLVGTAIAKGRA